MFSHNSDALKISDPSIYNLIKREERREERTLQLIASENYVSNAVLVAQGSVLTNKYAEGYPNKRFYQGCNIVDEVELIAIERLKKLFGAEYANVQPHSGSQANQAAFLALLKPGDTVLAMSLECGGHLTHGAKPNLSGQWFNFVHYGVNESSLLIDYNMVESLAKQHKPKLIICGFSAYSRELDFAKFKQIADSVGAYLMADIAHIAGIIAAGYHMNPLNYVDVVTSTTHKTLRGARGGIIMTNKADVAKKIDSAIFPGLQGGPLMHIIAAKAVAFAEALLPEYKTYIEQVLSNAKTLAEELMNLGYNILTNGTSNHLILIDLRSKNLTGKDAGLMLEKVNIICNKNSIPFDTTSPFITSGIRIGTPATTTRGLKTNDFTVIAKIIDSALNNRTNDEAVYNNLAQQVDDLCTMHPIY